MGEAKNRKHEIENLKMKGEKINNFRVVALKFDDSETHMFVSSTVVIIKEKNEVEMPKNELFIKLINERTDIFSKMVSMNKGRECEVSMIMDKVIPMSMIDEVRNHIKMFSDVA